MGGRPGCRSGVDHQDRGVAQAWADARDAGAESTISKADHDLERILEDAREIGLLGPEPVTHHIEHSRNLAAAIGEVEGTFVDLGSGAGIPGFVLAQEWPRARGILLDAHQRRCRFLEDAVDRLDLGERVGVRCGRAETLAREPDLRGHADVVVARSFGRPAVTAECGVGFLRPGGRLVVSEPPDGDAADLARRWPADEVRRLGFAPAVPVRHGAAGAVVLVLEDATDERWPRADGRPAKAALW